MGWSKQDRRGYLVSQKVIQYCIYIYMYIGNYGSLHVPQEDVLVCFGALKNVDVARLDTYLSKLIYMILCVHPTSSNRRFFWNHHLNPIVLGVPQTILNLLRIFGFMDIYLWIFIDI